MVEASRKRRFAATSTRSSAVMGSVDAHAPLLDAIAANPDDPAPWAVYADLLQTDDHPRGELISLMMERERQPSMQLLEAQRRQLGLHEAALLPATIEREAVVAWRRGFVSELRLTAPEQLANVQSDLSLRFVEAATLVIDSQSWNAWGVALAAARMPWRRIRIEITDDEEVGLAPLLACCAAVERLRIAFPLDAPGMLIWDDARAAELKLLVLVNAGEVTSLDECSLPLLEELRLLGDSVASEELRTSLVWNRLKRVVVANAGEDDESDGESETGPIVQVTRPVATPPARDREGWEDDEATEATAAFLVVGQSIQPAFLRKLAARISIAQLSARVCTARWAPWPVTVIQFFGTAEAELLPYGLAVALGNVLDPAPPIALIEVDEGRAARYLVLGDVPARATQERPDEATRRALDLALGHDAGSGILENLLEELAVTPIELLLGDGGTDQLTMIDPSTAPLVVPEDENYDEDEDEEDEDEYYDLDDGYYPGDMPNEEPPELEPDDPDEDPGLARPANRADRTVRVLTSADDVADDVNETELATGAANDVANDANESTNAPNAADDAFDEAADRSVDEGSSFADDDASIDDHDPDDEIALAARPDDEDALAVLPEREDLWFEFRDHWEDRAVAIDDEPGETRWPDPQRKEHEALDVDFEALVAEPACARHVRALHDCKCGVWFCPECGGDDEREDCPSCIATVAAAPAIADAINRDRVDLDRARSS